MFVLLDVTHCFIGNDELLPNANFPLVFDIVYGQCQQEVVSKSFYNEMEVDNVIKWIQKLIRIKLNGKPISRREIGVIAPYTAQCNRIREDLYNNGIEDITVGTAEVYQGQERRVIIISTVRTDDNLGFVRNSQVRQFKLFL